MRIKFVLGLAGFLLLNLGIQAQIPHNVPNDAMESWHMINGNQLYSWCAAEEGSPERANCQAYVAGVADLIGTLQGFDGTDGTPLWKLSAICMPKGANTIQTADVVLKYLKANPEDRAGRASLLVMRALLMAWRCPANEPSKKE
jgi:hypothetical protein